MSQYFRILFISLIASLVLVPFARFIAFKFDILDHPKTRKIHKQPMPKLGGLAMYLAFVVGTLFSFDYNHQLKGILIGSSIILFIGLIDDIRHLRASLRLVFQIIASVVVVTHGVVIKVFPYYPANVIVTIIGIIGITNALNFLDNMDGLAGGIAAICSFGIAAIAYHTNQRWLIFLSVSLLGSCLGFLRYNFKPAKIFMGDSGSTFLGFTIASMSIMSVWSDYKIVAITIPVLIMGLMIFDTTMITVLRIVEGKVRTFRQWLEHADTDHVSHRLVHMGLSEREAVMFLYICNFIMVGIAISMPRDGIKTAYFALAGYIFVCAWGIWKLHQIKIKKINYKRG
ncbi:MAG: undecaprenyl/decaprenyl-phosphate alpha-N-acetylglucosaminyl 1-phosphate transferase [Candidatus Omnitrophica bacterium]|nr:undecaprenyl/decaprenyl-phosphate alpha-N-acetylglucosaminyl 1-phosphate transferase [Candidatus Omnitrophota bacterium]MBU1869073.1 undecaprenyl/decaprenyl-phosphate alpha-N-acetylglucosaminyl 1-phosphate transferase [Candidatus Omnitrophota bacterium]